MTRSIVRAKRYWAAASLAALATTSPVMAQQAGAEQQADADQVDIDDYGNDIVVTAQGREQIAQDVPLAVSVVNVELIKNAGIVDVSGLKQLSPSLQATTGQSNSTGTTLSIRGIGTGGDNPGFEPAVGVFVDGVFRARAGLALASLPPLERAEILRGPQGTLFGRNTSAGALNIITAGPQFNFGGYAEASYGNYDEVELKAGITGPISQQLAFRLDGGYHVRDGYLKDVNSGRFINNLDRWFARGQFLFEADALTVRVIGDYYKTDEECCGAVGVFAGATGPAVEFLASLNGDVGIATGDRRDRRMAISTGRDFGEAVEEYGLSAQVDYEIGDVTLTSITAYRDWYATRNQDVDFSGVDRAHRDNYRTGIKDFTQEIRLRGTAFDGVLDWLVGGFYLNEELTLTDTVRFGTQASEYVDALLSANTSTLSPLAPFGFSLFGSLPNRPFLGNAFLADPQVQGAIGQNPALLPQFTTFLTPSDSSATSIGGEIADSFTVDTNAIALFTHNIINISDALSLTLGLRYNHEKKKLAADLDAVNAGCAAISPGGSQSFFGQVFAGQTALNQIRLLVCNPVVNPEFNGTYEDEREENEFTGTARLAWKATDDILAFAAYSRGYKSGGYNLDRGGFDSVYFGGNGAQASDLEFEKETVNSFELGLKTNFSRQFQFNVTGFYQDFAGYQNLQFEGASFVVRSFAKVVSQGVELESIIRPDKDLTFNLGYTYVQAIVDDPVNGAENDGLNLVSQPRNIVAGAVTWTPFITDDVNLLFHTNMRFNGEYNPGNNDPDAVPFIRNQAFTIVNARVGLEFADGNYGIEAYVENLFDDYYSLTSFPVPEQAGYAVYPSQPRFYGLRVRAAF